MNAVLAFDTATEHLSVALEVRGRVHGFESAGGAQASARLIPAIVELLADAGIGLQDLDAIAFGRGPGAFTGLRTACAAAQGLALGAGKPLLPIDTLLAVAEDARAGAVQALRLWVAMDARMGQVYAAQYRFDGRAWSVLDAPMLTSAGLLSERWQAQPALAVAGNALAAFGAELVTGAARCIAGARPRATAMLPLAHALWQRGGAVDAALALPVYLRDKVAQTTLERDAARNALPRR